MADKIETIDMSIVRRRGRSRDLTQMLDERGLSKFVLAYDSLRTLFSRVRNSKDTAPVMYKTPPLQTTVPRNPTFTDGSDISNSSAESKPEDYVNDFTINFLKTAFFTIDQWIEELQWANPDAKAFLCTQ